VLVKRTQPGLTQGTWIVTLAPGGQSPA